MPCLLPLAIKVILSLMALFAGIGNSNQPELTTISAELQSSCGSRFKPQLKTLTGFGHGPLEDGDAPWLVLVTLEDERRPMAYCAGTILTATHVLTSSDCGLSEWLFDPKLRYRVGLGLDASHWRTNARTINVTQFTRLFTGPANATACDLMILELDTPLLLDAEDNTDAACIDGRSLSPAGRAAVMGWQAYDERIANDEAWLTLVNISEPACELDHQDAVVPNPQRTTCAKITPDISHPMTIGSPLIQINAQGRASVRGVACKTHEAKVINGDFIYHQNIAKIDDGRREAIARTLQGLPLPMTSHAVKPLELNWISLSLALLLLTRN